MQINSKELVDQLDKKIIGQDEAKKALAVALENRWGNAQSDSETGKDTTFENIIITGSTGVGKTAIVKAITDIIDISMVEVDVANYTRSEYTSGRIKGSIYELAELIDKKLTKEKQDEAEDIELNFFKLMDKLLEIKLAKEGIKKDKVAKKKKKSVTELIREEGMIFFDGLEKLAIKPDEEVDNANKMEVQKDLLAILNGTEIETAHGVINTKDILFITAGTFHLNEIDGLMPELLKKLPIHVKLDPLLTYDMLYRILKGSESSPINHYRDLSKTKGVNITVTNGAIEEISDLTSHINKNYYNMGAKTLIAVLEKAFSKALFDASNIESEINELTDFTIDEDIIFNIRKEILNKFNAVCCIQ